MIYLKELSILFYSNLLSITRSDITTAHNGHPINNPHHCRALSL